MPYLCNQDDKGLFIGFKDRILTKSRIRGISVNIIEKKANVYFTWNQSWKSGVKIKQQTLGYGI